MKCPYIILRSLKSGSNPLWPLLTGILISCKHNLHSIKFVLWMLHCSVQNQTHQYTCSCCAYVTLADWCGSHTYHWGFNLLTVHNKFAKYMWIYSLTFCSPYCVQFIIMVINVARNRLLFFLNLFCRHCRGALQPTFCKRD